MQITDGAKELIENFLSKNGKEGLRLSAVQGCCGPQYVLTTDEPQESDKVEVINGIRVAIDPKIPATDELTLDKETYKDGETLVLLGANGGGCC
ncbi:MAG: adhesin [Caldibacillus debilis]|uniref:adhesin n=1 Tax=Caldibacillus debilis TaxID=301148 RepID=UPI000E3613B2|nr:adhesin [Caldibacillus debilis]REJ18603.1 MAG: adhesin [Caldibacillus debilis]